MIKFNLQFNFILAHVPGVENPAADYLSRLDIKPQDRIHLKLHDTIPVQHIEVDLASQTPKQDEEEDDYDSDAQPVPDDQRYTMTQAEGETVLEMIPRRDGETDDDFKARITEVNLHLDQLSITTSADGQYYTKFVPKGLPTQVNQVSPSGEFAIVEKQRKDLDIQRMVRILKNEELPPNNPNFCSMFFQKLNKNRKRLEIVNDVLYRNFFDNTGKIKFKQVVVPDSIVEDIIRSLHNDPMQGHPGSSKMLNELRKRYYAPNLAERKSPKVHWQLPTLH